MPIEKKRFTISVTPSMELALDAAKRRCYPKGTQTEMLRDLIARGLATLESGAEQGKTAK